MGLFTNYPDLTPKMIRQNKPHSPATGLGHITASRSNVKSTRPRPTSHDTNTASSTTPLIHHSDSSGLNETLHHYDPDELPDTVLRCRDAIISDLPGRFPVPAKNHTEYLLLSVYKGYTHVEPLVSRSTAHLCAGYLATYLFFRAFSHHSVP
jgi:hypothetical protein